MRFKTFEQLRKEDPDLEFILIDDFIIFQITEEIGVAVFFASLGKEARSVFEGSHIQKIAPFLFDQTSVSSS